MQLKSEWPPHLPPASVVVTLFFSPALMKPFPQLSTDFAFLKVPVSQIAPWSLSVIHPGTRYISRLMCPTL